MGATPERPQARARELLQLPLRQDGRVVGYSDSLDTGNGQEPGAGGAPDSARDRMQQAVVSHLQEAIQPPVPVVSQMDLGVHYLSADPSEPTGGDLYDWYVLPDGDLHVVVVDVIGKGISATKDALAVVHTLRVLVLEGFPLETLVATADRLLTEGNPELVATLLIGRYSPTSGRLVLAGGGHPPMLLVSPDGEVEEVVAEGIPLGWPGAGSFELVERTLARSQTAVFYTDGLIEARRDILVGMRDLKAVAAETATYPARELPRVLVERALLGAQRRDDALALVVRRRTAPSATGSGHLLGTFEYRFSPLLVGIGIARHFFEDWLWFQGIEDPEIDDLAVVVSDLCTIAVEAAVDREPVVLRGWPDGEDLVFEVEMAGAETPVDGPGSPVARSLVDTLLSAEHGAGTVLRCRQRYLFTTSGAMADNRPPTAPPRYTRPDGFSIDAHRDGARVLVTVCGDVDGYARERIGVAFAGVEGDAGRHVVVDLAGVVFIDSAGIAALSAGLSAARASGALVSLHAPTPQVVKLFELTGIHPGARRPPPGAEPAAVPAP